LDVLRLIVSSGRDRVLDCRVISNLNIIIIIIIIIIITN
jgi:hypothetical protein